MIGQFFCKGLGFLFGCAVFSSSLSLQAMEYEGTATFRNYGVVDAHWMQQLLPYNPVFVEIGAYCGKDTCRIAQIWPKGRVYAFEPNPRAYALLKKAIHEQKLNNVETYPLAVCDYNGSASLFLCYGPSGNDLTYEPQSSLLAPSDDLLEESIDVPCVALKDWCEQNQIQHIDVLKLETEGLELEILESSAGILKDVKVIQVQSFFTPLRKGTPNYFELKRFLTKAGFVPLAHWYEPGYRGNAVYVSLEIFDGYFVHSLGLGSGGISYP